MPLLVTGGTGYLGEALVKALSEKYPLRLLVRDTGGAASLKREGVEVVQGDVRDRDSLKAALKGCEAVFHLAALVKSWVRDPSLYEAVNVEGFRNLAEGAWAEGVQKFVYTSSILALPPADATSKRDIPNPYVLSKKKALSLAQSYQKKGYPLTTVIPAILYGPGAWTEGNHISRILEALLLGRFPGWIDGGKWRWNFAYIEDAAVGHRLVLEKGKIGETYLLGGETVSLRDFFTRASEISGCPLPQRGIPVSFLRLYAFFQEMLAPLFSREPALTRGILATYRHDWDLSDEKAREELGYRPLSLQEGLRKTIQWLKQR